MKLFVRSGVKEEIVLRRGVEYWPEEKRDVNNNLGFLAQNEGGENREVGMDGV